MAPTAFLWFFSTVAGVLANAPDVAEPVALRAGEQYYISTTETMNGWLELEDKPGGKLQRLPITDGTRTAKYVEYVLPSSDDAELPDRVYRVYDKLESKRNVNGQVQVGFVLRPEVSHIILQRSKGIAKPYSPRGPLKVGEIESQSFLMCAPALNGLLPKGKLEKGARWTAARESAEHLA